MPDGDDKAMRERFLELDQGIRDAIERRDGELAKALVERQSRDLMLAAHRPPDDEGAFFRETRDRLEELVRRAEAARDALGIEIGDVGIRRKLSGTSGMGMGNRPRRSFRA
jgi:hypothetical protein